MLFFHPQRYLLFLRTGGSPQRFCTLYFIFQFVFICLFDHLLQLHFSMYSVLIQLQSQYLSLVRLGAFERNLIKVWWRKCFVHYSKHLLGPWWSSSKSGISARLCSPTTLSWGPWKRTEKNETHTRPLKTILAMIFFLNGQIKFSWF